MQINNRAETLECSTFLACCGRRCCCPRKRDETWATQREARVRSAADTKCTRRRRQWQQRRKKETEEEGDGKQRVLL
uniref:Uncharacterized protein n=1 Tax=Peronospora matthiolae TaxID=2874970 RepID=A0AAV1T186_9STRA